MLTAAYYSVANIEEFQRLSFRSLYWIGNGQGQPVVDPAMSLAAPPGYSDNDSVVTIHLGTGSFNPTWFTEDQLTQITPLPVQAWDKTSAAGPVGSYDETTSGAKAVFNFLTAQSKDIAS
jgi:hypothetical protein